MERIGIYGGTFNPPHLGHVRAVQYALQELNLDQLMVIPDRVAPHKTMPPNSPSPEQRHEMLRLAFGDLDRVTVSDLELNREGPSYTYQTVQQVRSMHPDARLFLLMGTDMFLTFREWKNAEMITRDVTLAVFYRGGDQEEAAVQQQKAALEQDGIRVVLVNNPVYSISSTDLRRMLVFRCAGACLPPQVLAYITRCGLYNSTRDFRGLTMEQLEPVVRDLLKQNRVAHVMGVRDTAVALAERWGADPVDAGRAGILHDITKALGPRLQLTLCREYGTILSDFSVKNPKTLHAFTGALVAEHIFGENQAVVSAIRHHTTGKAGMNLLEKIIYVADYMEPGRKFEGVERLRELAFSDLDAALALGLQMTIDLLTEQKRTISPESVEALNWARTLLRNT